MLIGVQRLRHSGPLSGLLAFVAFTAVVLATVVLFAALDRGGVHAAPVPLDHYACYPTIFSTFKTRKVTLADQFGKGSAVVSQPAGLCTPARKNGSVLVNPRAHLVCYPIRVTPQPKPRTVFVRNQFGSLKLLVVHPETLCVPSSKSTTGTPAAVPKNLDHYTCYTIDPESKFQSRVVKLADQFGTSRDTVVTPARLCAPTRKNGSPLIRPRLHLMCYQIKSPTKGRRVAVRNQFGLARGLPGLRQRLCVPSTKTVQG